MSAATVLKIMMSGYPARFIRNGAGIVALVYVPGKGLISGHPEWVAAQLEKN